MFLAADIGDSAQRGANEIGAWVPNLIAAVLILVVGYIIARVPGSSFGFMFPLVFVAAAAGLVL